MADPMWATAIECAARCIAGRQRKAQAASEQAGVMRLQHTPIPSHLPTLDYKRRAAGERDDD